MAVSWSHLCHVYASVSVYLCLSLHSQDILLPVDLSMSAFCPSVCLTCVQETTYCIIIIINKL